jgi:hypothetical protein
MEVAASALEACSTIAASTVKMVVIITAPVIAAPDVDPIVVARIAVVIGIVIPITRPGIKTSGGFDGAPRQKKRQRENQKIYPFHI